MTDGPISRPIAGTRAKRANRSSWMVGLLLMVIVIGAGAAVVVSLFVFDKHVDDSHMAAVVEMRKLLADQTKTVQADSAAYQAELAQLGLTEALKPGRLTARAGIDSARAKIAQAHAIIARYRNQEQARRDATRNTLYHSSMDLDDKRRYLNEFDNTEVRMGPIIDGVWDLQDAEINEASSTVDMLIGSRGRWQMVRNKVLFLFPADLNAFAAHQQALAQLHAQEQALNDQIREGMRHPPAGTDLLQN
jgi:hypothetical protein